MTRRSLFSVTVAIVASALSCFGQEPPLRFATSIAVPGVARKWDHFAADLYVYDASTKLLYVVNGGRQAHTPYCLISVVDVKTDKKIVDIKLDTNRLESMTLDKSSSRLFVNMTGINKIGVIDRVKRLLS